MIRLQRVINTYIIVENLTLKMNRFDRQKLNKMIPNSLEYILENKSKVNAL